MLNLASAVMWKGIFFFMSISRAPFVLSCHVLASNCQNNMQGQPSAASRKYVHTVQCREWAHLAALCWNTSLNVCGQCHSWRLLLLPVNSYLFIYCNIIAKLGLSCSVSRIMQHPVCCMKHYWWYDIDEYLQTFGGKWQSELLEYFSFF